MKRYFNAKKEKKRIKITNPLLVAVTKNQVKKVEKLLKLSDTDVNKESNSYLTGCCSTPLYIAARNGNTKIVRLLLKAPNINVNKRS